MAADRAEAVLAMHVARQPGDWFATTRDRSLVSNWH